MRFHLDYKPAKANFNITHQQQLFLIGSCFAENIGIKLKDHKFKVAVNPNGVLFNPISILQTLTNALRPASSPQNLIIERNGQHFSFQHHSKINANSREQLADLIQQINQRNHVDLKNSEVLIITFGTAFHYYHKALNTTVANCHKQSQQTFDKKLLSVFEISEQYNQLIAALSKLNPDLQIIFTVSPVKHLKDGVIENNLSKATLLLSINEICKQNANCFYFPAYELVTDDLRDYRFYKSDLAHPNEQAIDYVWNKFSDSYFDTNTKKINFEIEKLNSFLKHQPLHPGEQIKAESEHFIQNQKEIIQHLNPQIVF